MIKVGRNPLTTLSLLASGLLGFILLGLLYRLGGCPLALLVRAGSSRSRNGSGLGWLGGLALTLPRRLGLGSGLAGKLLSDGGNWCRRLQLLGHNGTIIDNLGINTTNMGHGDVEFLAVADGLVIGHLLSGQVSSFVRVYTGIVQPEVVLVGLVPALDCGVSICELSRSRL